MSRILSRSARVAAFAPLLLLGAPLTAGAQDEPRPAPTVETDVVGLVLINAFWLDGAANNSDVPQFAVAPGPGVPGGHALGATVRQSRLGLFARVPEFAGGELVGELDVDFFGGQQPSTGGRTFPLVRIRRAIAEYFWGRSWLFIGQESPPIAEVNPSSLASIGFPEFAGAGNLWLWIPQVRVGTDVATAGPLRIGVEGAVLAPSGGEPQTAFFTQPDIAERSARPFLQGRLRGRWGGGDREAEVSLGGHLGWLRPEGGDRVASRAAAASVWAPIGRVLEVRGEVFVGRGVAGLGGGAIGQNLSPDLEAVETIGGWAQLNVRPNPAWEAGAGAGIDDPDDEDLGPNQRARNLSLEAHAIWRPAPLVVGLTVRHLRTRYVAPATDRDATQLNLALGWEF